MKKLLIMVLLPLLLVMGCNNNPPQDDVQDVDNGFPVVTIEMKDGGIIKIELYPEIAPNTVSNFIDLIEDGYYDGLIFHRVIPNFMIQGGCPQGTGFGNPGYAIRGEFQANGFENNLKHERGVISMARSQSNDSAGSQFFIMVAGNQNLDGAYAAFGRVISGMEVVDNIVRAPRGQNDRPHQPPEMKRVTVNTFGRDYGRVEKIGR